MSLEKCKCVFQLLCLVFSLVWSSRFAEVLNGSCYSHYYHDVLCSCVLNQCACSDICTSQTGEHARALTFSLSLSTFCCCCCCYFLLFLLVFFLSFIPFSSKPINSTSSTRRVCIVKFLENMNKHECLCCFVLLSLFIVLFCCGWGWFSNRLFEITLKFISNK